MVIVGKPPAVTPEGRYFASATWDCGPTSRWTHGVGSLPMKAAARTKSNGAAQPLPDARPTELLLHRITGMRGVPSGRAGRMADQ